MENGGDAIVVKTNVADEISVNNMVFYSFVLGRVILSYTQNFLQFLLPFYL